MIRANSQGAPHAQSKKGETQCPKRRKADLEVAHDSFQGPTFLLKYVSDRSAPCGLGYKEREDANGEQADACAQEKRSGPEAGSFSIHLLRLRVS